MATVQQAEKYRNKEQGRHRRKQETTNHSPAQWSILLSTFAQAKGHRHHSDNHCQRCHDHRPEAREAGTQGRDHGIMFFRHLFFRKTYNQYAIRRRHSHTHNGSG